MIKQIYRDLRKYLKLKRFEDKWRKNNIHNRTHVNTLFPINKVKVGKYTYGKLNVHFYNREEEQLEIGSFCSIADEVHFFLGGEHDYKNMMTYPFKNILSKNEIQEAITKGPIIVEDDVWIGHGTLVLSGVHIGKGAVIGAKSVVSKDIPPYAIFVGNKVIKYRFDDNVINKLLEVNYNDIDINKLESKMDLLYKKIDKNNIDKIIGDVIK